MKRSSTMIVSCILLVSILSAGETAVRPAASEVGDTPQIYIEVVLIQASDNGGGQMEYPEEIARVVENMRSLFKFTRYSIIGRADAVGLKGSMIAFSSQSARSSLGLTKAVPLPERRSDSPPGKRPAPVPEQTAGALFEVHVQLGSSGDTIICTDLTVTVHEPRPGTISASVNIRDGETLVLGASRGNVSEEALITVVTARLIKSS